MKKSKTREELVKMYVESLEGDIIPWRQRWASGVNVNGVSKKEYKGVNQLILTFISSLEHYTDNRWLTYNQIKDNGYKLKEAKGKGVPIEFWSIYDIVNKKKIDFNEYEKIINKDPELKENYKMFCNISYVFNADLIEGIPEKENLAVDSKIQTSRFINNAIKSLKVKYRETGFEAYYIPLKDEITLPESSKFFDEYSYYATQLHELCHSTGHESRLNRNLVSKDMQEYAREELIAEISSSFLMQKLNINPKDEDYNNHKSYIQGWIKILKDKPNELFKAINESNKVCDFIEEKVNTRNKQKSERSDR